MSRSTTKLTNWHVPYRRLRSAVWSESSLSIWRNHVSLASHLAQSGDSDQTGRMSRLIWVFAGRMCHFFFFFFFVFRAEAHYWRRSDWIGISSESIRGKQVQRSPHWPVVFCHLNRSIWIMGNIMWITRRSTLFLCPPCLAKIGRGWR